MLTKWICAGFAIILVFSGCAGGKNAANKVVIEPTFVIETDPPAGVQVTVLTDEGVNLDERQTLIIMVAGQEFRCGVLDKPTREISGLQQLDSIRYRLPKRVQLLLDDADPATINFRLYVNEQYKIYPLIRKMESVEES